MKGSPFFKAPFTNHCVWTVGRGNISFWYDTFLPEFNLAFLCDEKISMLDLENFVWIANMILVSRNPNWVLTFFSSCMLRPLILRRIMMLGIGIQRKIKTLPLNLLGMLLECTQPPTLFWKISGSLSLPLSSKLIC